ncbi:thiamine pyrophosphate-requiring protein [Sulfurisphaera javensis]|uniref:2-oxoacid oxidoreductase (ferredoxin) n=1 Tax=Sulfurisphaera javensis TaxID=2049879 RepID=A0AAT9GPI2_9CREN
MDSGARLILKGLKDLGVDKIFMVSGTDYAAFIEEKVRDPSLPEFIIVPHEITATAAAIGYSLSGKIGVVALHTIPGTANALGMIINAYTSRIPLIVLAGRSPYTEVGSPASRNLRIHWTQEAKDQGEIVRQWVKYDFEIRRVEQIPEVLSRAFQLAFSEPKGPVYIVIPREVSIEKGEYRRVRMSTFEPGVKREDLEKAKKMINESERPLIVTWRGGRRREWFDSIKALVDKVGIPIINYVGEVVNYEGEMGLDMIDFSTIDLLIVIESEVPYIPKKVKYEGKILKIDVDPSYSYIPYYGFSCDLCIQSIPSEVLSQLNVNPKDDWKEKVKEMYFQQEKRKEEEIKRLKGKRTIHPRYLSYVIGKVISKEDVILNEYPFNPRYAKLSFGQYFADPSFGHLGWALGSSFGFSLSGRKVIATVGDGAFIFGVPEAFYYAISTYGGNVTVVIYDNGGWLASAEAVEEVFPEGLAKAKQYFPGADFKRYNIGETVKAFGGYYRLVESTDELEDAVREAYNQKGIAVLQVIVERER